jgi:cytochrome c-type biogenesis protein CcmH
VSGAVRRWALVAAASGVVAAAAVFAGLGGGGPATIEDRAQAIASGLRCPVCQNLSVADSPSRLAGEMRSDIEAQLRAGRTDQQVQDFFVARYGEWVLLDPARKGLNLIPWTFPIAAALGGAAIWVAIVRRPPRPSGSAVSEEDRRRIERDLGGLEESP